VRPCGDCRSSALPEARRTTFPKAHWNKKKNTRRVRKSRIFTR